MIQLDLRSVRAAPPRAPIIIRLVKSLSALLSEVLSCHQTPVQHRFVQGNFKILTLPSLLHLSVLLSIGFESHRFGPRRKIYPLAVHDACFQTGMWTLTFKVPASFAVEHHLSLQVLTRTSIGPWIDRTSPNALIRSPFVIHHPCMRRSQPNHGQDSDERADRRRDLRAT